MKNLSEPVKIIFFDIDETLYIKKSQTIPKSISQQVLPLLRAKQIIPAIATGRTFCAFPKAIEPLMNEKGFELFVTTNGQYNLYKGNIISFYPLSTERVARAVNKLKALNIEYAFVGKEQIAVSADTHHVMISLSPIKPDYIVDPTYYLQNDVIQLLAFYDESQQAEIEAADVLEQDLKEVRWHEFSVDLLNKYNSKARGIKDVLTHLNIDIGNTMAFGDGLNDIEMLEQVGFGVAMGNAEAILKTVADYVTLPIEQEGILEALKTLKVI